MSVVRSVVVPLLVRRKRVVTLDEAALASEMKRLWEVMLASGVRPDGIVGVATGGVRCAMHLRDRVAGGVMTCAMRRPGTARKKQSVAVGLLARMPYAVTDELRRVEDALLARKAVAERVPEPTDTLRSDVPAIAVRVRSEGLRRLAVIDDAVDSGGTLGCVMGALRNALPQDTELVSAVVTQTRPEPLVRPDFRLHDQVLCRFPWSFDFRGA